MTYLIPSSIFKNVFSKNLRDIMLPYISEIYDYNNQALFSNVLVSSSIILFKKNNANKSFFYYDMNLDNRLTINKNNLSDKDKWLFTNDITMPNNYKFGDYFKISNSVATLYNTGFVIRDFEIIDFKYIKAGEYLLERAALRRAAKPGAISKGIEEMIIFPYFYSENGINAYSEKEFTNKFPKAYAYLNSIKDKLLERKSDKNAQWFEYGRSQALNHLNQEKLLVSSVITHKINVYNLTKDVIPYSGFYIIPIAEKPLEEAIKIMKSKEFYSYLIKQGINANGISLRFSVKDFINYPIDN